MKQVILKRMGAMALSFMLSIAPAALAKGKKATAGTPDTSFNVGGPVQGITVVPMSPFLNIVSGVGLQKSKSGYKIVAGGDAVAKPQPLENTATAGCPGGTNCPPPATCPNDCSGTSGSICNHCIIDGYQDERVFSLLRLNSDGSVDTGFGPNGNGKIYTQIGNYTDYTVGLAVDSSSRIVQFGVTLLSASSIFDPTNPNYGSTGQMTSDPTNCFFQYDTDPTSGLLYGTTEVAVVRYNPNGSLDTTFGFPIKNGIFKLDPILFPSSTGDFSQAGALDALGNIIVVGGSAPNANGCGYAFPLILRLLSNGTLDPNFNAIAPGVSPRPGTVVEGTGLSTSNFTDNSQSPAETLQYAFYIGVAVYNNDSPLKGRIIAIGSGDVATATRFYPFTARVILARYMPDGNIDTSFGINGYMVLSALNQGKQILARSVAIDVNDNLYVGGDIADIGSGAPGTPTAFIVGGVASVVARPSANFLLIKLNEFGIPADFGPSSFCNSASSTCNSSVFDSCSSCVINYNTSTTGFGNVRVVTTDFKGADDAIFALSIDDCKGTITAIGQASQDAGFDTQVFGFARYFLKDGSLDSSFGTGGLAILSNNSGFRTLARAFAKDPCGKLVAAGQSAFGPFVAATNFSDATPTNFAIARINS